MYDDKAVYLCEIMSQHLGESRDKKTPYFAIEVWPTHRIHFGKEDEPEDVYADQSRTVFIWLTEKNQKNATRDLISIGANVDRISDLDPDKANHFSVVGRTVKCLCEHEFYEGKTRDKFQLFSNGGGLEHTKPEPKRIRELDSLFGKALKAAKPVRAIQEELGVPVPDDDKIQF